MPKHATPMIDELLGDSLIQAVMRADKVEPQGLRILLAGAAGRIAARRAPNDRRSNTHASARLRPAPLQDCCGSAFCC